jgi:hypothetical protein
MFNDRREKEGMRRAVRQADTGDLLASDEPAAERLSRRNCHCLECA